MEGGAGQARGASLRAGNVPPGASLSVPAPALAPALRAHSGGRGVADGRTAEPGTQAPPKAGSWVAGGVPYHVFAAFFLL